MIFFFFKQKTAYEIKECDWSSDVCSSDLGMLANPLEPLVMKELKRTQKVIINDTIKAIIIDAHIAGQTVINGNSELAYAEEYVKQLFPA